MTPPGWYDDPWQPGWVRWWDGQQWTPSTAPRPQQFAGYSPKPIPLDASVAAMQAADPEPWGWRPVLVPLLTYVLLIVSGQLTSRYLAPRHGNGERAFAVIANIVLEAVLAYGVYLAGRDIAARNGGWARAFGFRRPRWADVIPALIGFGVAFGARILIGIVAAIATHGKAIKQSENLQVGSVNAFTIILLVATAVIAAPIVEELVFRGLFLRTFLRRMPFWPAAVLSSVIFGAGHTYEVSTLAGALTLAFVVGSLGLTNCVLNRYTDSLVPGMIVHASFNGLAIIFIAVGVGNS
jgi:membrane protease YdiL (CAAX protease family)